MFDFYMFIEVAFLLGSVRTVGTLELRFLAASVLVVQQHTLTPRVLPVAAWTEVNRSGFTR